MTYHSSLQSTTAAIDIYIKLANYPVLADRIRQRMRQELFQRGVITREAFDAEVKANAIESQKREGLLDPFVQEEANIWQKRKERIRDYLTDAYFAFNLGNTLLEQIIAEVRSDQPAPTNTAELRFNPEIAPWELLFRQGELYEQLPEDELAAVHHHLEEIKVVLIKRLISDQLPYIGVAKRIFSIADLRRIYRRRIGTGKIGGKSAGFLLAWRILQEPDPETGEDLSDTIEIPDSYFLGTEVLYEFRLKNDLDYLMNQKYRPLPEIREEYPHIVDAHLKGEFPKKIVERLREVLADFGSSPIIVRSSSLLEDNFGYAFAGKYNSYFCPNQGTDEENLEELLHAIKLVFASTLNPDALLYRQKHNLIDYDERMAVLIQRVRGKPYHDYFFPSVAGVAFSENPFRWNPKIRREEGFLRMVWGMGTRAVDRVANDYPRMIALSHPQLRPEMTAGAIRQYSQSYIDAINLKENRFETLPVQDLLHADYPELRYIASLDRGDYVQDILSTGSIASEDEYILTFNYLTRNKKFTSLMRTTLERLETAYSLPVDVEFTVDIIPDYPQPTFRLSILQCRPLSQRKEQQQVTIPKDIADEDILFTAYELIPDGGAEGIRYIVFVDPMAYRSCEIDNKHALGRAISRLNRRFENEPYILIGPGRWGSVNIDLGVQVTYADIHNTKVLVEMAVAHNGQLPELSYGTHFFQDLVEAGIYSLPLHIGEGDALFNWEFFRESPNLLAKLQPEDAELASYLRVIDLASLPGSRRLNVLMDGRHDRAIGYLDGGEWLDTDAIQSTLSTF
ncbi:MAG: PEP/pyruvate-binding domain-containing protein [Candidatus Promineifilaceae bacterium]